MKLLPVKWNNDDVEGYTVCGVNMSFNGDKEVLKHRKELANLLHTDFHHMVAPGQKHTTNFQEVFLSDGGKGIEVKETCIDNTDALYTKEKNLLLMTFHADCCPVLLYDPSTRIIATIHSGWKGTVNEIVYKVTHHLIENEHCDPDTMYAYIGPSLEQRNFEAMDDIIDLVKKMSFDTSSFYIKKDETHYLLDSKGLIHQQLLNCGLEEEHIDHSPLCTTESDDFFSYRKTKTDDRNITIIRRKH